MDFNFYTTDVFTDRRFGGNPLAVFPKAAGLNDEQMQLIAREFNISETIFVFPPEDDQHTVRVRIFTPARELDFAGHPTVGCAYVLATLGQVQLTGSVTNIVLEENVGPVPVKVFADSDGRVIKTELSSAKMPEQLSGAPSLDMIAEVLSLEPDDILEGTLSPEVMSAGVPFLIVPVKNREALGRSAVNLAKWREHLENTVARDMFLFCFDPELEGSNVRARMYAPSMGIAEDPATGAAATAFAGYLAKRADQKNGTLRWVMEQGFEMDRPSILEIETDVKDGVSQAIRVGGSSVLVSKGTFFMQEIFSHRSTQIFMD